MTPMRGGTKRNLERKTDGAFVAAIATLLGTPFLPWQRYVADVAGEIDPETGTYFYDKVTLSTPRQAGKSTLVEARTTWAALQGVRRKIFYLAQTGKDSEKYFKEYIDVLGGSRLMPHVTAPKLSNGGMEQGFKNGSLITPVAITKKAGHGVQGDLICIDEAFALSAEMAKILIDGFAATIATRRLKTGIEPQVWVTSTEGTSESEFLNNRLDKLRNGEDFDERHAWFDWGIPEDSDPEDFQNIYEHHPAAGYLWDFNQLRGFRTQYDSNPGGWARAFGNRRDLGRAERVFDIGLWQRTELTKPIDENDRLTSPLAFGVAVDIEATATAICAASLVDGHVTVELIEMIPGFGSALPRLRELQDRYHAPLLMDVKGSGAPLADRLTSSVDSYGDPLFDVLPASSADILAAGQSFLSGLEEGTISHVADDELDLSAGNASRKWVGDAWRPSRHLPAGHSSPIEAAMMASWAVTHLPADTTLQLY